MYKQYTLRSLVLIQSPSTQSHQVSIPSPLTSSTSAQIQKSIMTSSTPNPSQMRRTSGSFGMPSTLAHVPLHTTQDPCLASPLLPPRLVNPHSRPPPLLPPQRLQLPQHLPPTHIPPSLHGIICDDYAAQHTSDLVRWPLLKYGGVYADVGLIQIGDLDRLWHETVSNPSSPFEVLSYDSGASGPGLANFFFASRRDNPFFARCSD